MYNYEIKEVEVDEDDPLYPRTVYRIYQSGERLVEKKNAGKNYSWEEFGRFLPSSYLTKLVATQMLNKRILREDKVSRGLEVAEEMGLILERKSSGKLRGLNGSES